MANIFSLRSELNLRHQILVTGATGFIGKNLVVRLNELPDIDVKIFSRGGGCEELTALVANADAIFHLAGVNRPKNDQEFTDVNVGLTSRLCDAIRDSKRRIPLIYTSSSQVDLGNEYGQSKFAAESVIQSFVRDTGGTAHVYRLPGVFGKWCRPNYNSVVATFCHNISRGLPIRIDDPDKVIELVYIDDLIDEFLGLLGEIRVGFAIGSIEKKYLISVGQLAKHIERFKKSRINLVTEPVGKGFIRALYSTYVSYIPPEQFVYDLTQFGDGRGIFVEMLKTPDCGQFSFFTVIPGVTRGSHYHHTKTEKFLVVKGNVLMRFRNLNTGQIFDIAISSEKSQIVDSIPGWVHDITNIGNEEAIVMLWANEIFDRERPDCIPWKV